jgi:hypothetical protein
MKGYPKVHYNEKVSMRDDLIGSMMGPGAIPLNGRENMKLPCHGCRIDPTKPFEPGNAMLSTREAIGVLSKREAETWCSELIEETDGRCRRAEGIREAAKTCKAQNPNDSTAYFNCFLPYFKTITGK